jgi:ribosomal peptide maturation radical SAM protein 1
LVDILLCSMPFGLLESPSLGLSLLKASLKGLPYSVKVRYFSFLFASQISLHAYRAFTGLRSTNGYSPDEMGDWLFSAAAFEQPPAIPQEFVDKFLKPPDTTGYQSLLDRPAWLPDLVRTSRPLVESFLEDCLVELDQERPRLVGFTCMFNQRLSSLALARLIKSRHPETFVVFGGKDCLGEIGVELVRRFPFIDAVVSGSGEQVLPEIVRRVMEGTPVRDITGVYTQAETPPDAIRGQYPNAPTPANLDQEPFPDFTDFFEQRQASSISFPGRPYLVLETARGCWWRDKGACIFCNYNNDGKSFTAKSPDRALAELEYMNHQYPGLGIEFADDVVCMDYFNTLFPALVRQRLATPWLLLQVRATLSKNQLRLLRAAGVTDIQPGIESLSTEVLKLMHKGVSLFNNLQILKWAKGFGMDVNWNILYGFPGEPPAAYARMADLIPNLTHLQPPSGMAKVNLLRFSPLFEQASALGLKVRPMPIYSYIYPFEETILMKLARVFAYEYGTPQPVEVYTRDLIAAVKAWRKAYVHSNLTMSDDGETLRICDQRPLAVKEYSQFTGIQRQLYLACDAAQSMIHLQALVEDRTGILPPTQEIERELQPMLEQKLMLREGQRYLSLALPPQEV